MNECDLTPAPCKFSCENTEGSFRCSCPKGYILAPDGITCRGKNGTEKQFYHSLVIRYFFY